MSKSSKSVVSGRKVGARKSGAGRKVADAVSIDASAFAFLNGKASYTRKLMLDVEPLDGGNDGYALVFRGEDKQKSVAGATDTNPARGIWNDETGAARAIHVATYANESAARADCDSVRDYFRAFSFPETTRQAHLKSESAQQVARLMVSALGSAPYGAKSGNVRSFHEVQARRTATRESNVNRARKLAVTDPAAIANDPAALAAILAAAGLKAPAPSKGKGKMSKTK